MLLFYRKLFFHKASVFSQWNLCVFMHNNWKEQNEVEHTQLLYLIIVSLPLFFCRFVSLRKIHKWRSYSANFWYCFILFVAPTKKKKKQPIANQTEIALLAHFSSGNAKHTAFCILFCLRFYVKFANEFLHSFSYECDCWMRAAIAHNSRLSFRCTRTRACRGIRLIVQQNCVHCTVLCNGDEAQSMWHTRT